MTPKPDLAPDKATIYRDDWGVPHIYAGSRPAGFYALGYAQAEDRPQRTLWLFLFARGETASQMGPQGLAMDVRNRLWRHREMAARGIPRLTPDLRADHEAYLAGIRAYFEAHRERRPEGAIDPDLADVLALERAPAFFAYQSNQAQAKCQASAPADPAATASNGWAVMPGRTAAGALILGADPHVQNMSAFYYEFHMEAGGVKSSGFSLGPYLWQAHTRHVSWAMTTGGPDAVDVYEVEFDPARPDVYLYDDEERAFLTRRERFEVKGAEPVEMTFEYTLHNGVLSPVIERRGNRAYVACAPAMDHAGRFSREIMDMNLAGDVGQVREALRTMGMFQQNLIVGDRHGGLFYVAAGATAIRPAGYDWDRPVPGNTSASAWRGLHLLEDLVQVLNPRTGYLQNNNVAPDTMAHEPLVDASDYPKDVFNERPGFQTSRGVRAVQVLSANPRMTVADAIDLAMDETWVSAPDGVAALAYAARAHPDFARGRPDAFRRVLERLLAFDGRASADSQAAAAFLLWREGVPDILAKPEFAGFQAWPWNPQDFTPAFGLELLQRLDAAVQELQARHGSVDVALGDIRRIGRGARSWPVGGITLHGQVLDMEASPAVYDATMRAFRASGAADGKGAVTSGSQAMRLVSFTDPIESYSLYAFGQSDDPASPHYDDQARLFSERRMKPTWFEFADLADHIQSTTTLTLPEAPDA